jgi:hypothetical protein
VEGDLPCKHGAADGGPGDTVGDQHASFVLLW